MPAKNTPLDTIKNTALRATESIASVADHIAGGLCDNSHGYDLEWLDSIEYGIWQGVIEHVPGISWSEKWGRPVFTPEGRQALTTYDDGSPVSIHLELDGYVTDYYPRFDGSFDAFYERFKNSYLTHRAESIAYEAAHPAPNEGEL